MSKAQDDLRRKAEELFAARDSRIESLGRADLASLAHELAVHQIELEIQNEELRRTRTLAEEARDRYLDLYDFAPVGYFTLDEHLRIVEANLTGCRLLHVERVDLLDKRFTRYLAEEETDQFYLYRKQTLEAGVRQTCDLRMRGANGIAFDARLESVRAGEGRLRVAVIDVTERKRVEDALRESEERYHRLFEDDLTGDFLSTPEGRILLCNPAFARMFGYASVEEAVGTSLLELYVDTRERGPLLERLKEQGKIERLEVWRKRRDGQPIYIVENLVGRFNERGELCEIKGYLFDDTERKRAEEARRESEEKYRYIVETATEGIVMVDAQARVVFANDRWSEIFGYSLDEARHMTHFDMVFPEDRARMAERWESRKRGVKENYEFRFRRKDGRPVWTLVGVAPRLDPEGKFLGTLVMVTDITQRKRMEEALRELNATLESKVAQRTAELERRARQLQRLMLELSLSEDRERRRIAEVLHDDLQQMLAAAKFHLGLLKQRAAQDPAQQAIVVKVEEMLKDAIAKSRSLSHELSPAVAQRNDLAETLVWLAQQMRATHGLTVRVDAPKEITLQSDALTIFFLRTAREMLFNVIKHAGVGEAAIRVRRRGRYVCMSVSDRGRGFDPREQRETGGFGLFAIRERVELLGGRLKIKSAKGKGSTFFIVVPDGQEVISSPTSVVREEQEKGSADHRLPDARYRQPIREN